METTVQNNLPNATGDSMPWLTFKLANRLFAVHSSVVESIFQLDQITQKVCVMPETSGSMRGVITLRDIVVPLMDVRSALGISSLEAEKNEFSHMLQARKQDHLNWVAELHRCVEEDTPFTLTTDPHKCAFGKWYYSFRTENSNIRFFMNKIEEPHRLLHQSADAVFACSQQHDECKREKCLKTVLAEQSQSYVTTVLGLLDQIEQAFQDNFKQMCVVLNTGEDPMGLLVDEVVSVGALNLVEQGDGFNDLYQTRMVKHVATSPTEEKQILVLDHDMLFSLAK